MGSPPTGTIAQILRNARARYHAAVQEAKKNASSAQSRLMAASIASGEDRNLWTEVKRLNGKSRSIPATMKGSCGEEVAEVSAHEYGGLYNSVSYTQDDMDSLMAV